MRGAVSDLYFSSPRFIVANLLFGVALLTVLFVAAGSLLAVVLIPLLVPPAAGLMRLATVQVRERNVVLSDFWWPMRRRPVRIMAVGIVQVLMTVVLLVDLFVGTQIGGVLGPFLSVSAVYALLIGWIYACIAWPLLLDPVRDDEPAGAALRLAAILLIARPLRLAALGVVVGLVVLVSTVMIAAAITFALALAFLIAAHDVLPAADRLQERATQVVLED